VLTQLRGAVDQLEQRNELLQHETSAIDGDISEVMVALQFQDRTGQILRHVQNDLLRLESDLQARAQAPDSRLDPRPGWRSRGAATPCRTSWTTTAAAAPPRAAARRPERRDHFF
jgi:hypothetical protein